MRGSENPLTSQVDDLIRNIKSTAGSRFGAAKRLENRDKALTRLTAFTSAYIIILTVIPYFVPSSKAVTDHVNLATVALAIIVLVSSLFQYSNGDVVNAEQHHRCALEMKELRREMKARRSDINTLEFLTYSQRYSVILQKYSVNHDDIDYLRHKLENQTEYGLNHWEVFFGEIRLRVANGLPNLSLAIVTLMCGALAAYALLAGI
jgi:hypothetical protein